MKYSNIVTGIVTALILSACSGAKVLKEAQPIQTTQPLATVSDQQVTAILDWVIVRDGPGTWAKNADWDEYLLRVSNLSDQLIQVTRVTVVDSLDTRIEPQPNRKQLVKGSKQTTRRYKGSGIKVKAGLGVGTMVVAGAAVTTIAVAGFYSIAAAGRCGQCGSWLWGSRGRRCRNRDSGCRGVGGSGDRRLWHSAWRPEQSSQQPD